MKNFITTMLLTGASICAGTNSLFAQEYEYVKETPKDRKRQTLLTFEAAMSEHFTALGEQHLDKNAQFHYGTFVAANGCDLSPKGETLLMLLFDATLDDLDPKSKDIHALGPVKDHNDFNYVIVNEDGTLKYYLPDNQHVKSIELINRQCNL